MSNFQQAWGTIIVPEQQYSSIKEKLLKAFDERQAKLYEDARVIYTQLREPEMVKKMLDELGDSSGSTRNYRLSMFVSDAVLAHFGKEYRGDDVLFVVDMLLANGQEERLKIKSPVLAPATDRSSLAFGTDGHVSFDNEKSAFVISIGGSNHSFEHAANHYLYKQLEKSLNGVSWEEGTGGIVYYEDSYSDQRVLKSFGKVALEVSVAKKETRHLSR